jgi:hypothetical protein
MKTMPVNRQPSGVPAGGQFAASPHAESDVTILEPDTAGRIESAYAAVNEALASDGMRIGPPSPRYNEDRDTYNAAVAEAKNALDAAAGPGLRDEIAAVIAKQFAEHRANVESERASLTAAIDSATKARTAAEALAAFDGVIDLSDVSGSAWKAPSRAAATSYAQARLDNLDLDRRFHPDTHGVADALGEPKRTWIRTASWDVIRDHFEEAMRQAGVA